MTDSTSAPRPRPTTPALGAIDRFGPTLDRLDPDTVLTSRSPKARAVVAVTNEGAAW